MLHTLLPDPVRLVLKYAYGLFVEIGIESEYIPGGQLREISLSMGRVDLGGNWVFGDGRQNKVLPIEDFPASLHLLLSVGEFGVDLTQSFDASPQRTVSGLSLLHAPIYYK
jgi:hypothetical protein